jgi:hypothetical protein
VRGWYSGLIRGLITDLPCWTEETHEISHSGYAKYEAVTVTMTVS